MDGDLEAAEPMVRAYLLQHGDHVEAMRLLARIGMARKVFDDAELLLSAVLELAPDYRAARAEYAEVLIELQRYPEARRQLERLLRRGSREPALLSGTARHHRASASASTSGRSHCTGSCCRRRPRTPTCTCRSRMRSRRSDRAPAAIASYRTAADSRPGFGDAYWSLANLKTYRFTDQELARLRASQAEPTIGEIDRYHLHFALGKALEDQGEFAEVVPLLPAR